MKRLEAFCDAVAMYNRYNEPESESYEIRNPGLLLGEARNTCTPGGKRIFSCHRAGYAAFVDMVGKRCAAHPNEPVKSLLEFFGVKMRVQQEHALDFMSRCANSNALKLDTPIEWFLNG